MNAFLHKLLIEPTSNVVMQLLRYVFVGGVAFVVDFGLLYVLTEFAGFYYLLSATISFIAGLIVNYLMGTAWIFHNPKIKNHTAEFIAYALVGLVGLVLNNIFLYLLTSVIGLFYLLSKVITALLVMLWNFFGRRALYK